MESIMYHEGHCCGLCGYQYRQPPSHCTTNLHGFSWSHHDLCQEQHSLLAAVAVKSLPLCQREPRHTSLQCYSLHTTDSTIFVSAAVFGFLVGFRSSIVTATFYLLVILVKHSSIMILWDCPGTASWKFRWFCLIKHPDLWVLFEHLILQAEVRINITLSDPQWVSPRMSRQQKHNQTWHLSRPAACHIQHQTLP